MARFALRLELDKDVHYMVLNADTADLATEEAIRLTGVEAVTWVMPATEAVARFGVDKDHPLHGLLHVAKERSFRGLEESLSFIIHVA